ncbi:DUF4202 family protein [Cohaesibacter haloalkalitolerans]|uniref:DUF4202 family protein n=1 Tax=Cohaesibacter haloalkalitolerans TaxID=1162980 RepID=UPI000E65431A|nr:DUF4202 family protein [Cohaesibacter haloalkalitolerans]
MSKLDEVLEIIDQINAQDPRMTATDGAAAVPSDLIYGMRMSLVCDRFAPMADDCVKIAARGQYLESWLFDDALASADTPSGPAPTEEQQRAHSADKLARIMAANGYNDEDCITVRDLLQGSENASEGHLQLLEDLNGLVFVLFYAKQAIAKYDKANLQQLLGKALSRMSDEALSFAWQETDDPIITGSIQSTRKALSPQKRSVYYLD